MSGEEVIGEAADPDGARVVLLARVWHDKVLSDHADDDAEHDLLYLHVG